MFIHEMTFDECRHALQTAKVGRLACSRDGQPYSVPISFVFDDTYIYGFTTVGQKIEWMRANPLVCLEVDEIVGDNRWMSMVVSGRYEELPDEPEFKHARIHAHRLLQQQRAMWWEPAYMSQAKRDRAHSSIPVFYRIHIKSMTGHRATADEPVDMANTKGV